MDIERQLMKGHSRANTDRIVAFVGNNPKRFAILIDLFLRHNRLSPRAAWPVSLCVEFFPQLGKPWIPKIIKRLQSPDIDGAVKRNAVRLIQFIELPQKYHGRMFELCSHFLQNKREAIAVKVFSMSVLSKISENVPELQEEIRIMIVDQLPYASAGFKARAKRVLKELSK